MNHRSIAALLLSFAVFLSWNSAQATEQKEWTFLLFINGHNNLSSFGAMNINSMEEVGSSNEVNLVVQWAANNQPTKRLLVQKDTSSQVTSPIVESLPRVDMGDYRELVKFVQWGVEHYPAKKYFIAVWNHGNGWHRVDRASGDFQVQDISYDDYSGHKITTEQLGLAMAQAAQIIGHKVDLYGSDACLMAMAEIASEMKDSVVAFAGSEEVEPGEGWPYAGFAQKWVNNPTADALTVGHYLSEEFLAAYSGGVYGNRDVTFSVMNLEKLGLLEQAMAGLTSELKSLPVADIPALKSAAQNTQGYYSSDYRDLKHFIEKVTASTSLRVAPEALRSVEEAISEVVTSNHVSDEYRNSHGVAIWLPVYNGSWGSYGARYKGLKFHQATGWGDVIEKIWK